MNTYQVHVVARRCAAVRDHACARFLRPWNAATAVRLNRRVSPDGRWTDCYSGRRPSGSFRLISYETRRDRLITVEFVAQLYRRPLRPRMNAAIVLETRASISSSFRRSEEDVSSARRTDESGVTLVTWKLEQGPRLARLIATAFFGDDSAPRSSSLIGSFPLRRRSRSRKRCSRSAY